MGWRFELKDANIVAYLTSRENGQVPRIRRQQLGDFLMRLEQELASPNQRVFFSSQDKSPNDFPDANTDIPRSNWSEELYPVVTAAFAAFSSMEDMRLADREDLSTLGSTQQAIIEQFREYVPANEFSRILSDFRKHLNGFDLYGMPIDPKRGKITEIAEQYALETKERGLFLLPTQPPFRGDRSSAEIEFLDPFPAVAALAKADIGKPGILFWTNDGVAAYQSNQFFLEYYLKEMINLHVDDYSRIFLNLVGGLGNQTREIIHLSDLHFGTEWAYKNRTALKNELRRHLKRPNRIVVVTGDLFEILKERDAVDFEDFRSDLTHITGRDIIVIPGNHDQRIAGNSFGFVGKNLKKMAELEWTNLFIDDEIRCVFFCFDSSFESNVAAKGKFCDNQRSAVENAFNAKALVRPEIKDYFRVTLIHHHPFSFETKQESLVQRLLTLAGMTDERFLAMDRSEDLIKWCANMEIPLILHGHKHVQRHFTKNMNNKFGRNIGVTAAGCGASLGAEDKPLTYNVISFNDETKSFGVTFYEDDGTGGGFVPVKVSLQVVV